MTMQPTTESEMDTTSLPIPPSDEYEMRRSNQQLLHSLANHTHHENGNAVFTAPPGSEPSGANPNQRTPAQ